jgi:hypothetical protein
VRILFLRIRALFSAVFLVVFVFQTSLSKILDVCSICLHVVFENETSAHSHLGPTQTRSFSCTLRGTTQFGSLYLELLQLDIKTAFLNGKITEEIYIATLILPI